MGQELTRPHQVNVYLLSRLCTQTVFAVFLHNYFIKLPGCVVRLSLTEKQLWHLIKRGAADRLRCKNAGAAELWVPVAFLTAGRPLWPSHSEHSLQAFKQPLKTTLECLITVDSHTRSTLWLFFSKATVILWFEVHKLDINLHFLFQI